MDPRLAGIALLFAAVEAQAVPLAVSDVPDSSVDACLFSNTTLGVVNQQSAVVVDNAHGKQANGFRMCESDASSWAVGPNNVSMTFKRTSDGAVSTPFSTTITRPSGSLKPGDIKLVAGDGTAAPTPPPAPAPSPTPAPSPAPAASTLFGTGTPTGVTDGADPGAKVTVGTRFVPSAAGTITGLRFYKYAGNTGAHIGNIWSSSGVKLVTANYTAELASGWQEVLLATPLNVVAGTTYVVSYSTQSGHYAFTPNFFKTPVVNGKLTASAGLFSYATPPATAPVFPTGTFQQGNYWVDVIYKPN